MKSKAVVWLWVLALVVPLLCVVGGDWLFANLTARPGRFMREPDVSMMQSIIVALPFVFLAGVAPLQLRRHPAAGPRALALAAAIGFVVTAAIWGMYYYDGYLYWKNGRTSGANIGAGLLMLASPVIVGLLMTLAFRLSPTPK
ncbi:MAG TPA: hypothetical protein VMZ90_12805 [Vicinamibacterales bacterium]|nr:hypothetical protein [Vicinamibacterales bacterium]